MSENYQSAWLKRFEDQTKSTDWASELKHSLKRSKPNLSLAEIFPADLNPASKYAPEAGNVFQAFKELDPRAVKHVVVGQDPYSYESGDAIGLAFLSKKKQPPDSLENLIGDRKLFPSDECDLVTWSRKKGILLLNAALTIPPKGSKPKGHYRHWRELILVVIEYLHKSDPKLPVYALGRKAEKTVRMALHDQCPDGVYCPHPSKYNLNTNGLRSVFEDYWKNHGPLCVK